MGIIGNIISTIMSGDHDMASLKHLYDLVQEHENGRKKMSEAEYEEAKKALSFLNYNG